MNKTISLLIVAALSTSAFADDAQTRLQFVVAHKQPQSLFQSMNVDDFSI